MLYNTGGIFSTALAFFRFSFNYYHDLYLIRFLFLGGGKGIGKLGSVIKIVLQLDPIWSSVQSKEQIPPPTLLPYSAQASLSCVT